MKALAPLAIAAVATLLGGCDAELPSNVAALVDTEVDPCDNFYQHACGTWLKTTDIPASDLMVDTSFMAIDKQNVEVLKAIAQAPNRPLLNEFWASCMDKDTVEEIGNEPLKNGLRRIRNANTTKAVLKVAGELYQHDVKFGVTLMVNSDISNALKNTLYINPGDVALPDSKIYKNGTRYGELEPELRQYVTRVLKLAMKKRFNEKPQEIVDAVMRVDMNFGANLPSIAELRDPVNGINTMTVATARTKYPLLFGAFMDGVKFESPMEATSNVTFGPLRYFNTVEQLLSSMPVEDLKWYLSFHYVHHYAPMLSEPFVAAHFDLYSRTLKGQKERTPQDRVCVERAITYLPHLVGQYFFEKKFDKTREQYVQMLAKGIEHEMHERFSTLAWLDDATRQAAQAKLAKVTNLIGRSYEPVNYSRLDLRTDRYLENLQALERERFRAATSKIGRAVDRTEWFMSAATVNAYYAPGRNQIVFPAAILQHPFFAGDNTAAQNFGAIGAVVGHELTHGFDTRGRMFDGDGNMRNWWSANTTAEFETRAQCLKEQYSRFQVKNENGTAVLGHVNGNQTIGENIADNGGVSMALKAYRNYMVAQPQGRAEKKDEQVFFLSFAQLWCSKLRDGLALQRLSTGVHSPGVARVNGVAMNSPEFAAAFQCPLGSNMNPEKKCKVW
ncbi:hypothetical protein P43SY_004082 [Pythium insidiosum]|uniref:M13 family peptidase n=1 Tax=Pythium insidiosum TaxID=114742 RepID=A0AAD5Q7D1_PYTIN|nr:hypothetical protein P43SY_004082 [Pythium insidiosum]